MAIAGAHDNQHPGPTGTHVALVDRWALTGTSPCACIRGGRVLR